MAQDESARQTREPTGESARLLSFGSQILARPGERVYYEVYEDVTWGAETGKRLALVDEKTFLRICKEAGFSPLGDDEDTHADEEEEES